MSLKQEIETWVEALNHYDANEFIEALEKFDLIADTSKIFFNIGVIHATLGEHEKAVEAYQRAVKLDVYFAVAYFQQGVSNFLLGDFEEALANFNDALLYLRGNTLIDYDQLGLKFRLYSCEVLFNRGLCYMYLQQDEAGMQDFSYAVREKQVEDHNVIDEAIRERAEGYTVFSIPVGVVYRPNESKVRNVKTKDYLGKARLVAAADKDNTFTGFAGSEVKKTMVEVVDDRQPADLSYAAMNLVIPGKTSKASATAGTSGEEPVFPPTPPPERDAGGPGRGSPAPSRQPSRAGSANSNPISRMASSARSTSSRGAGERRDKRRDDIMEEEDTQMEGGRYAETGYPQRMPSRNDARSDTSSRRANTSRQDSVRRPANNNAPQQRRRNDYINEEDEEMYDVYDYYGTESSRSGQSNRMASTRRQPSRRQPDYDDDYQSEGYEDSEDEEEFEMMVRKNTVRGTNRRAPDIKKIKVKVHGDDTRMIIISTDVQFNEFMMRLKEKMGMSRPCKCKIKDEDGEMILVADQEDLEMAVSVSKKKAKRDRSEMGKLEIWVSES